MDKQEYFLKKHGIVLDKSRSPEEQNLQMKIGFGVKDIETGDKPYIFISYSHKDSAVVFPAIKALQEKGYPVWYDDSIRTGVAWRTHIAERVRDSALVIAFMSENSVASKNCIAEVDHAIDLNLPILTVRLDRSPIPPGLGMYLNRDQMFQAYLYDGDAYITRLAAEPIVAETAGAALEAYNAEKRRAAEEAERKRREAEEAERRRIEAEEAERKRKEKAEADRRRRMAKAAEERQRKLEMLARQRREVEETERKRREETEAEIRRLEEEQAELERQEKEAKQSYVDPVELEKQLNAVLAALQDERNLRAKAEEKCQETAKLLEMERKKNQKTEKQRSNEQRRIANLEAAASKLSRAEKHIAELEDAAKKREEAERITPEMRAQKAELTALHDAVQDLLLDQTYTNYRDAIGLYNNHMKPMAEFNRKLEPDVENCKNTICKTLYRDARILEKKKQKRMAYALYNVLPEHFSDAGTRKRKIEEHTEKVCRISAFLIFGLCLVANGLLVLFFYGESFWTNTLISLGPMITAVCLWCIYNWKWFNVDYRSNYSVVCFLEIIFSALIFSIACPFLYPEMEMWKKIVTSVLYNGLSGIIGIALLLILTYALDEKEYCNIKKISD